MDIDHKYWLLIQRFITGNADEEQLRLLNEWMNERPENRKLVQELKEIWQMTPSEEFEVDVQEAWEEFKNRRVENIDQNTEVNNHSLRKVSKLPLYVLRVAAVIMVSLFAGVFMQYTLSNNDEVEQFSDFYVMQTFETERGEKARVTFSDGTKVTLNSASSIRFPQEFRGSKREVYLDGEAYFEVAHDKDHPFIVYAQDAEVEVLGTEFNVHGWSEDESVEVAVREGKVSVGSSTTTIDEESQVILTEGLYTSVKNGEIPAPAQRVNVTNHLVWTHGGLHFDNEPFSKVVRDIERRFNVDIEGVCDKLRDVPYTGTFQYADLDEVLSVIGASMGFEYRRDGLEIIIQ